MFKKKYLLLFSLTLFFLPIANTPSYANNESDTWKPITVDSNVDNDIIPIPLFPFSMALDATGDVYISTAYKDGNLVYFTNKSGIWITTTVDDIGLVGEYSSIAIDVYGFLHISYAKYNRGRKKANLYYATNKSGTWEKTIVDKTGNVRKNSIAIDASGVVHIIYDKYKNHGRQKKNKPKKIKSDLYYATNKSGTWEKAVVDKNDGYGYMDASIAVGTSDYVHIIYEKWYDYNIDLYYAINKSGTWEKTIVDNTETVQKNIGQNSIAIDSLGFVHICYEYSYPRNMPNGLYHVTNKSGTWVKTIVDQGPVGGSSIAIGKLDSVHISYNNNVRFSNNGLKYATINKEGTLDKQIVADNDRSVEYTSIKIDASGFVHISYVSHDWEMSDTRLWDTKYATNKNKSGEWDTDKIGDDLYVGEFTSIAIGKSDSVHISYYDRTNGSLKYATNETGTWTSIIVGKVNTSTYTSISLDTSGSVHITFNKRDPDKFQFNLCHITNKSGTWVTDIVDKNDYGNFRTFDMAIDASGFVHISYEKYNLEKETNKRETYLYYATNKSGTWVKTIVDTADILKNSIAIGKSDSVHISYEKRDWENKESYLYYTTNKSGTWVKTIVDKIRGDSNSIAIDASGFVHISYYDPENHSLKYATNETGRWILTTVDKKVGIRSFDSIAVDTYGNAHISYFNGTLQYAIMLPFRLDPNGPRVGVTDTVESDGVGSYTSIALDTSGYAHISYFDFNHTDLKYATNSK